MEQSGNKINAMNDLMNKSNNEILFEIKQLEAAHEAVKLKMLKNYDTMVELEKKIDEAIKY
jgi:RNA-binding protein YhbY